MANKLFKHFGFSGKKVSSQPSPSREYSAKTSGSIQELRSKSPTKTRSSTIVQSGTTPNVRPDVDARRHSDASTVRNSLPGRGGAASRGRATPSAATDADFPLPRGPQSPDQFDRSMRKAGTISTSSSLRAGITTGRRTPQQSTPDRDRLALKTLDVNDSARRSLPNSTSSANGLPPRILDEYSDPFDIKLEIAQTVSNTENGGSTTALSAATSSNANESAAVELPVGPEDDYSVPYELKKQAALAADAQPEPDESPPIIEESHELPSTLPAIPKYSDPYDEGPALFRSLSVTDEVQPTSEPSQEVEALPEESSPEVVRPHSAESTDASVPLADSCNSDEVPANETDVVAITNIVAETVMPEDSTDTAGYVGALPRTPMEADMATYDEPWDLRAARLGLENRLRAVQPPLPPIDREPSSRTMATDPRPALEYDEPWDRRARDIQRSLISAKSAKEEVRAMREGGFGSVPSSMSPQVMQGLPSSSLSHRSEGARNFDRPSESVRASANSKPMSSSDVSGCFHGRHPSATSHSSRSRCSHDGRGSSPLWRTVAERIDPHVPLEQQGWYHGSISRVNAETLLRVHREGSYLVRMSESNRSDYSLSLKSSRGFMHMKIVGCIDPTGSHYILGQFSQPFDSIPQMIHHYTINKLPIKGAEHMSLLHPINNELL